MTSLLITVAALFAAVLFGLAAFHRSQVQNGYEDELGFHYGPPKRRRK